MKALVTLTLITLLSSYSLAASECKTLKAELEAMKKAQNQIMMSLVNNHETFATSMEEYSDVVTTSEGKSAVKNVSQNMNKSAEAFRTRGVQGKKMAQQLDKATTDLLARVAACL